jgi:hypothetical protein
MILDIYKDSLEYSAKDWKTLITLGAFCFFSFLLIPLFLVVGYNYRVINIAVNGIINGKDPLPEFDDFIGMFIDGVKVVLVQIGYLIIPVIIFFIFVFIASKSGGVLAPIITLIGCLVTFIIGIIVFLMEQMGICHMVYNDGSLSKAFAISEIKEVIEEIGWFKCLITYIGLIVITLVIASVVTLIIGMIFTVFGISGAMLGVSGGGIFILGAIINSLVTLFIVGPYLSIFNSRSLGLLYGMQI